MDDKNLDDTIVGDRIGVDPRHVRRVKGGERNFSISEIERFAIGLGVHPKELMDFDFELNPEFIPPLPKKKGKK
nr:helix-turn-helix transcriptional regulator [Litoribacter populi]